MIKRYWEQVLGGQDTVSSLLRSRLLLGAAVYRRIKYLAAVSRAGEERLSLASSPWIVAANIFLQSTIFVEGAPQRRT